MNGLSKWLRWLIIHIILQVIVVSGETGCGKTTQLPQYILESEIEAVRGSVCSIICTQPRRISAMSVSERVAAERGEKLGESVSFVADLMTCFKNLSLSIIFISRWTLNISPSERLVTKFGLREWKEGTLAFFFAPLAYCWGDYFWIEIWKE